MLALYLLACHLVGDFMLSTRWQARTKRTDRRARLAHVVWYTVPFVILALAVGDGPLAWYAFPVAVGVLHYLTDSRRFVSSLGDWFAWQTLSREERAAEWRDAPAYETLGRTSDSLPPNPWTPLPLMIDQTLHVCQLALLGGLLLS